MTHELKRLTLIGGIFVGLLVIVALLGVFIKGPDERKVLLSFDVEPVDGDDNLLDVVSVLDDNGIQGTFFVTGEYAEEYPELVKWLSDKQEVACHSYSHKKLTKLDHEGKLSEISRCKEILSNVTGKKIEGFRAPYLAIDRETLEILDNEGFLYDASYVSGLSWLDPSLKGLDIGEVPVSSFMMMPLQDVIWIYYLKLKPVYFGILNTKKSALSSYLFHPHHIAAEKEEFEAFIKHLKKANVKFITHSELIKNHGG